MSHVSKMSLSSLITWDSDTAGSSADSNTNAVIIENEDVSLELDLLPDVQVSELAHRPPTLLSNTRSVSSHGGQFFIGYWCVHSRIDIQLGAEIQKPPSTLQSVVPSSVTVSQAPQRHNKFDCRSCSRTPEEPVVTMCGHLFCLR